MPELLPVPEESLISVAHKPCDLGRWALSCSIDHDVLCGGKAYFRDVRYDP